MHLTRFQILTLGQRDVDKVGLALNTHDLPHSVLLTHLGNDITIEHIVLLQFKTRVLEHDAALGVTDVSRFTVIGHKVYMGIIQLQHNLCADFQLEEVVNTYHLYFLDGQLTGSLQPGVTHDCDVTRSFCHASDTAIFVDSGYVLVVRAPREGVVGVFRNGNGLEKTLQSDCYGILLRQMEFSQDECIFSAKRDDAAIFGNVIQSPLRLLATPALQVSWRSGIVQLTDLL